MGDATSYYTYRARPKRVIDGDTLEVYIDQGFHDYTVKTLRLRGVDTSEIYGVSKDSEEYQTGQAQKEFTRNFVEADVDHGPDEWPLSVRTFGKGKYGRWVAYVWHYGENLSDQLIAEWPNVEDE